jgi:hypothetical protein
VVQVRLCFIGFSGGYVFIFKEPLAKIYSFFILNVFSWLGMITAFSLGVLNVSDGFSSTDLDPVIYPMVQVMAGKSLLAPVTSFYGLYPFFLGPVFAVIGFSVLKFALVMAGLVLVSFISIKQAMSLVIKDRLLYLLGFLMIVFYTVLATRLTPEYYFQYWPIRFLFPCLSLWLVAKYLRSESRLVYFLSFLICSAAIFWNMDTGVVLFASWFAVLALHDWSKGLGFQKFIVRMVRHAGTGLLSFAIVTGIFSLITNLQSGRWPDFSMLPRYQKLFLSGYLNIGMIPPPHTWTVIIFIYLIGLLLAARALYRGSVSYIHKIIFFLSVLGLGLFAYYEGQSSDVTLFRTSYPALILVTIFADQLWEKVKTYGVVLYGEFMVLALMLFVLFSVPFSLIANSGKYYKFVNMAVNNISLRDSAVIRDSAFIRSYAAKGEKVLILARVEQGIYYATSQTHPILDVPSVADIVFPGDMGILVDFLNTNTSTKVFIKQPLETYDLYDNRIKETLKEKYKESATTENGLSFYEPR